MSAEQNVVVQARKAEVSGARRWILYQYFGATSMKSKVNVRPTIDLLVNYCGREAHPSLSLTGRGTRGTSAGKSVEGSVVLLFTLLFKLYISLITGCLISVSKAKTNLTCLIVSDVCKLFYNNKGSLHKLAKA